MGINAQTINDNYQHIKNITPKAPINETAFLRTIERLVLAVD